MMFLDTHVLVWLALAPERIPVATRRLIEREEKTQPLRVCEITLFEIAMLMKRKRLDVGTDYREFMRLVFAAGNYALVGLNAEIAALAVELPEAINKDPADRMIAASALFHKGTLITADANLRAAKILPTVWR